MTAAFVRREQLGSTAIGGGYAVPHIKHPAITDLVGAVAYAPDGIDFRAVDGEPVNMVILLISPPNQPGDHLRALERISRFFAANSTDRAMDDEETLFGFLPSGKRRLWGIRDREAAAFRGVVNSQA